MTKTQFRLSVVAIFAAIMLFNLTSPNRYKVVVTGNDIQGFVIDGVTGKIKRITENARLTELTPPVVKP